MAFNQSIAGQCALRNRGNVAVGDLEEWFEREGPKVHEAYGVETFYSTDQSRFIPGSEPPVVALRQFLVTAGRFHPTSQSDFIQYSQPGQAQEISIDLLNCSWDDVLKQLEAAKQDHLIASKKSTRKADRVLASAAPYMEFWIECLPEEYGLSVVKGGLALLFATARHKVENREKIIQTFEEIPDMIRTMDAAYKLFNRDGEENVSNIAKDFYDQLCEDIPQLVQILNGKSSRLSRVKNRLGGGLPETQTVDGVLARLKQKCSAMGSTISRIKMKLQAKSHDDLRAMRSTTEAIRMEVAIISGQLNGLVTKSEFEQLTRTNNRDLVSFGSHLIDSMRQEVRSEVKAIMEAHSAADLAAEAKTMLLWMTQENAMLQEHIAKLQIEYTHSRQPSPIPIPTNPALTELDLMHILNVVPQSWTDDLAFVLRQASRMDTDSKARARWLMKTRHFQDWFKAPHSALLLAVGAVRLEKVSPMSVLTSSIALNLLELPSTVVLHFFCGKHMDTDADDNLSGPLGMLRCLIAQLVLAYETPLPNLNSMGPPEFVRDCYSRTLEALCEVFRRLVEQISQGVTIFVLVDGVSWYEQGGWAAELEFIVGLLKVLSRQDSLPVFKVLLTSPSRTKNVQDLVDLSSEYVSLAPGNMDYMPLV
ncbi:hypothetical protein PG988_010531 [Apiospora saccharicola]